VYIKKYYCNFLSIFLLKNPVGVAMDIGGGQSMAGPYLFIAGCQDEKQ